MDTKTGKEIRNFCQKKFRVTFPLFQPGVVVGDDKQPVFQFLTRKCPEDLQAEVGFNFEKFLIGRDGTLKGRYGAFTGPMSTRLVDDIKAELKE